MNRERPWEARLLPRAEESHKGDYGHLLIVAGCQRMPGAAVLATGAALRSGCGLVTLHSTDRALQAVVNNYPSAMLSEDSGPFFSQVPSALDRYSAIAVGPGLGQSEQTLAALSALLTAAQGAAIPLVLDADALNLLAAHPALWESVPSGSVLTPHPGELRRLLAGEAEERQEDAIVHLCRERDCVLLAKGHRSRIWSPEGDYIVNPTGNAGLAKGGSGDVLTGLVGGLLARGYTSLDAAALGAWIHGYAGDILSGKYSAEAYDSSELIAALWQGFAALSHRAL